MNVSSSTLRRWDRSGRIQTTRTMGGHRRYMLPEEEQMNVEKKVVIYARVSTGKQRDDLERQVDRLHQHHPTAQIYRDVASGINWRRPGLRKMMQAAFDGEVSEIVIAHRDRLCRLGFELIEWVLHRHGCRITVLSSVNTTIEQELADDLMSIVQVFCCRKNGMRAKRK